MAVGRSRRSSKRWTTFVSYARVTLLIALGVYVALMLFESHRRTDVIHYAFPSPASAVESGSSAHLRQLHPSAASGRHEDAGAALAAAVDPKFATEDEEVEVLKNPGDSPVASLVQIPNTEPEKRHDEEMPAPEKPDAWMPPGAREYIEKAPAEAPSKNLRGAEEPASKASSPGGSEAMPKVCKIIRVTSAGKDGGDWADFFLDEVNIGLSPSKRGLNMVTIDPRKQKPIAKKNYDVWEEASQANEDLAADLEDMTPGTVVLIGVMDSGMENVDSGVQTLLREQFGAKIATGKFRQGYALIAVKGRDTVLAEGQEPSVAVSAELPCKELPPPASSGSASSAANSGSDGCKRFKVKVQSAGKDDGNMANFWVNGKVLRARKASFRGLNIVTLDPRNGKLIWKRNYDVYEQIELANEKLFDDIEKLPPGTVVLAAAMDSGMEHLDSYALDALQSCGASITEGKFRNGYALIGVKGGKKVAEKLAPSVEISGSPLCPSADYSPEKRPGKIGGEIEISDEALFVVVSDSNFYKTRVAWMLDTWASDLPNRDILVVADKKPKDPLQHRDGGNVFLTETDCGRGHHDVGCCKYAHAVFAASQRLKDVSEFEWFYFADDDVYVRSDVIKKRLSKRRTTKWPVAKGLLGCSNPKPKCEGICGGGGFLLNRKGLLQLVGNETKKDFVKRYMKNCAYCDHWGDLAVSKMIRDSKVKLENMKGLHPWRLDKRDFIDQLRSPFPPITFHYTRSSQQMRFLYKMFSPSQNTEGELSSKIEGDEKYACITYKGRRYCADSGGDVDVPWR